ncbi:succinate dehydrogenase [Streptomyces sp. A7024]|uniref:Succinate dehydrogenase n=1 Tax=Streptomyces coryli TaxID=1128680 RepID=A0A6G4UD58_9ACTN|nr:succinate dehydrogenase [Streptomyces coryli]NGN69650.1 succinate dehydrogenase [Streptomyces coryli]
MALATKTDRRPSAPELLWKSTLGKKTVMAVSGVIMLLYLVAHMVGNLKIFFGPDEMNHYAHWLRTMGEPVLHYEWGLWLVRVVLLAAVIAHATAAYQLSRRDIKARPSKYVHAKPKASYATRTMRWGGIILGLFIVWHILDLTTGTVHPAGYEHLHPYQNVIDTFSTWYGNAIYIVAMVALGFHIQHGFWAAAHTLGYGGRVPKGLSIGLAVVLTAGFVAVPIGVMTGVVS